MPLLLCPNCNVAMTSVSRMSIELDMCPTCRGVWLDRGELEKVLENERLRTDVESPPGVVRPDAPAYPERRADSGRYEPDRRYEGRPWDRDDDDDDDRYRGRRRGFSLFDIFD